MSQHWKKLVLTSYTEAGLLYIYIYIYKCTEFASQAAATY